MNRGNLRRIVREEEEGELKMMLKSSRSFKYSPESFKYFPRSLRLFPRSFTKSTRTQSRKSKANLQHFDSNRHLIPH
jgi:hypothetical protein